VRRIKRERKEEMRRMKRAKNEIQIHQGEE